jgi:hypothetical protein
MPKKVWRPEISSAAWTVVFGLVVLAVLLLIHGWYVTTSAKVDDLHAARQAEQSKAANIATISTGTAEKYVSRRVAYVTLHKDEWSEWIDVPAGAHNLGWDNALNGTVTERVYIGDDQVRTMQGSTDDTVTRRIRFHATLGEVTGAVYAWWPESAIRAGKDRAAYRRPATAQSAAVPSRQSPDDEDYHAPVAVETAAAPSQPRAAAPKVIANGPPGQRFDVILECGDRQLAIPEPHESPDYSSGLYGVTVRLPRDCWSEWLVVPQGYTPYVMDITGFAQTRYEIYPAHKGNAATASDTGRVPFTQDERAAFQSIRFQAGFISGNSKNIVKLLFTKP